jgi:hypothetical protein
MYELLAISVGREQSTPAFLERGSYYLKCQFASTVVFWTCLWSVKASFLAFFFQLTKRLAWPRRAWWGITAITALAFTGSIISYPLSCTSFTIGEYTRSRLCAFTDCRRCMFFSGERSNVLDQPPREHCRGYHHRYV